MENRTIEQLKKIGSIATFIFAAISFFYVSNDFIKSNRKVYKCAIVKEQKEWNLDFNSINDTLRSNFIIKNFGNKPLTIIDAWIFLSFPNFAHTKKYTNEQKENYRYLIYDINRTISYSRNVNWKPIIVNPEEVINTEVALINAIDIENNAELFPDLNKDAKIILEKKRQLLGVFGSNRIIGYSRYFLDQLEKNGKFINLYLALQLYLNNQEKIVKIPIDFIGVYNEERLGEKGIRQLEYSYLSNLSSVIVDLLKQDQVSDFSELLLEVN